MSLWDMQELMMEIVIKSVSFNFPVYLCDEERKEVFISKGNDVETVALLERAEELVLRGKGDEKK